MIVIPAIDLLDGKPVRLYQGDYNKDEQVGGDALEIARQFKADGAQYLHVVDLNGAKKENGSITTSLQRSSAAQD